MLVKSEKSYKYLIHTCNDREWYAKDYLVPSLIAQGIQRKNIIVWHDKDNTGNLASFVASCKWIADNLDPDGGTWHLQDDVVISKSFVGKSEKTYEGFATGFCNEIFDGERTNYIGKTTTNGMWFSFQCILIPNRVAADFAKWFDEECIPNNLYPEYVSTGKCDDSLFREWAMSSKYSKLPALNMMPNIVDHIDFLIGGTVINTQRNGKRQAYWRDDALDKAVEELTNALSSNGRTADFDSGSLGSNPSGAVSKNSKNQKSHEKQSAQKRNIRRRV